MFKEFPADTKPFNPMEQLMGVFPARSKNFLPDAWAELMYQPDSEIIDFYPTDFKIDLNGKKYAWQGVALLPFVDEKRLLSAVKKVEGTLSEREKERNKPGEDRLFISSRHPWFEGFRALYEFPDNTEYVAVDPTKGKGTTGNIRPVKDAILPGGTVTAPVPSLTEFTNDGAICVGFQNPQFPPNFIFPAKLLANVKMPEKTLKPRDWGDNRPGSYRPYTGFQRARPMSGPNTVGNRMLRHMVGGVREYRPRQQQQQQHRYPPPNQYNHRPRGSYSNHNRGNRRNYNNYNPYRR